MPPIPEWITVQPEVSDALAEGKAIVALESTVVTHGLPRPANFELARQMEKEIRQVGAIPATTALLKGEVHIGVSEKDLERLALETDSIKISVRDIGLARASRHSGGTTVAATMFLANEAGIPMFATGGIGGVHHGPGGDVSADLTELARTPVAVVCSGAKSILDLPRTLEWLETFSVPVIGWQTDTFPAFFTRESDLPIHVRVDTVGEMATLIRTIWETRISGILICVPCPEGAAIPATRLNSALQQVEREAQEQAIRGKDLTPFLLSRLAEITEGATLHANLALLRNNAHVAAMIAKALMLIQKKDP
ncbi:MAG: pseudouridine-5'-phosphate glycosidase [Anaerolineales bacterium]|nr:pseudouridine-5'-phosphate glycosidase [Anaerolineales bacterium]